MSFLYSTCSTPRSMSQMTITAFDEKASELDRLKRDAVLHMRKVNALKLEYMEWWGNRSSSFLKALHTAQMLDRSLCPQKIQCIDNFNKLMEMTYIFKKANKLYLPCNGLEHLEKYREFWDRLQELRSECDTSVLAPVNAYCFTITRLRDPNIKTQIDSLAREASVKSELDFDFSDTHNTKENLFAYRTGVSEKELIGFVGFIPHLANLQRKLLYLITKLYVEKE